MEFEHKQIRAVFDDPKKDVYGNSLPCRAIQLGLRGQAVRAYVSEWIIGINDITGYVHELNAKRRNGEDISEALPREQECKTGGSL